MKLYWKFNQHNCNRALKIRCTREKCLLHFFAINEILTLYKGSTQKDHSIDECRTIFQLNFYRIRQYSLQRVH